MNIFITINNFTRCFQFNNGDNVDKFILKTYMSYFEENNVKETIKEGHFNFLERNIFKLNKAFLRFGYRYILSSKDSDNTLCIKFLGGKSKNFNKKDIKYIKSLF